MFGLKDHGGQANTRTILITAMIAFGACKGLYDSGIFASLSDVIDPRARASAAGVMNTVGWAGGALGPLAIGWLASNGNHASQIAGMSRAISMGGFVYLVGAGMLIAAIFLRKNSQPGEINAS